MSQHTRNGVVGTLYGLQHERGAHDPVRAQYGSQRQLDEQPGAGGRREGRGAGRGARVPVPPSAPGGVVDITLEIRAPDGTRYTAVTRVGFSTPERRARVATVGTQLTRADRPQRPEPGRDRHHGPVLSAASTGRSMTLPSAPGR